MKKALLSLLLVAAFMPFAKSQDNTQRTILPINVTACQTYTWDVNHETYSSDTVVLYAYNADTTYVLNLTINIPFISIETIPSNRCSTTRRGETYTTNGRYSDTIFAATGSGLCDSVYIADITVSNVEIDNNDVDACGSYTWNGVTYTASGIYDDTTLVDNCAHVDRLNLSIVSTLNFHENVEHCGDYTWYGSTYTTSGTYTHTTSDTANTCDTVRTLHLSIVVDTIPQVTDEGCARRTWRGVEYTASGIYSQCDTNATTHCVTYRSINLTINTPDTTSLDTNLTGCNSVLYNFSSFSGTTIRRFTESTIFDTIIADYRPNKCMVNTYTLDITIHKSGRDTTYVNACDSFYWDLNQTTYHTTPTTAPAQSFATDTFGCDSLMTLILDIRKAPVISAINGEWHLDAGDTAVLYPTCTPSNATYKWTYGNRTFNGDTLRIPDVQGNIDVQLEATLTHTPTFACHDTSWITIVTFVGINDVQGTNVSLYPNPTVGQLNIESAEAVSEVTIYNALGQQVATQRNLGTKNVMNLSNLAKGTYTMRIALQNGNTVTRKFILTK